MIIITISRRGRQVGGGPAGGLAGGDRAAEGGAAGPEGDIMCIYNLHVCTYIYIYMYNTCVCMYIYIYMFLLDKDILYIALIIRMVSLSLPLRVYIYIYIHMYRLFYHFCDSPEGHPRGEEGGRGRRARGGGRGGRRRRQHLRGLHVPADGRLRAERRQGGEQRQVVPRAGRRGQRYYSVYNCVYIYI